MEGNQQNIQHKQKTGKIPTKKKAKKPIGAGTAVSILIIVAVIAFFALVYFNVGGFKQKVAELLELEVPTDAQITSANEQLALAEEEWAAIEQREKELSQKEKELSNLEEELFGIEQVLNEKIEQQDSALEQSKAKEETLMAAAKIFEQMDAQNAADAISKLETVDEMANLLARMTTEKAAQIMDKIKADVASLIAAAMMS